MTLNEAFAQSLRENTISHLEMSWNMKISQRRLDEILNGAEYTQDEELEMFRFVFKMRQKKNGTKVPQAVPTPEKSNGI